MERSPIGELLVRAGLVSHGQVEEALSMQARQGGRLCSNLLRLGHVSQDGLTRFFQEEFGFLPFRFEDIVRDPSAPALIPPDAARHFRIVPTEMEGGVLRVAFPEGSADTAKLARALEELTDLKVEPHFLPEPLLLEALDAHYGSSLEKGVEWRPGGEHLFVLQDEERGIQPLALEFLGGEVLEIEWLRAVLAHAIKVRAREVILEPGDKGYEVSLVKQGRREKFLLMPVSICPAAFAFLRRLSRQGGYADAGAQLGLAGRPRAALQIGKRCLALEVSFESTVLGGAARLRFLDDSHLRDQAVRLFREYPEADAWAAAFASENKGVWLLAGPADDAKQQFFYSVLRRASARRQNMVSLERSIRRPLAGLRQMEWTRGKETAVLEEALALDPPALAVCEMEDVAEAEKVFLAGARLPVLAVLTSYDSFAALGWLVSGGLRSPLKAGICRGVLALRAFDMLCQRCAAPYALAPSDRDAVALWGFESAEFFTSAGCKECLPPQERGRMLVAESLDAGAAVREWMQQEDMAVDVVRETRLRGGAPLIPRRALEQAAKRRLDIRSVLRSLPLF